MRLDHLALWVSDLELMRSFYVKYLGGKANDLYTNKTKQFTSYFISFDTDCRLELMHKPNMVQVRNAEQIGLTHMAFSLGSRAEVDRLTGVLRNDGFQIVGEPRVTGDGYYESVALDPEGNRLELTE